MFKVGDRVRIKSWEYIKTTLVDADKDEYYWEHRNNEISFDHAMKEHLDKVYKIVKIDTDCGYRFYELDMSDDWWWLDEWITKVDILPEELFEI